MSFELFIALRYLFARRKQAFISLISLISMIGVTVGGKALVTAGAAQAFISVKAIDPALEPSVTGIKNAMQQGSLDALAHESEDQPPAILIGQDLAKELEVRIGD